MTDPTQPRPRGRHSQPDGDSGRPASELLATWTTAGASTVQLADDTMRPRRGRRSAPDTDATGVQLLPPRSPADIADVEITGLAAGGIADVGLAAAGLDLSAFGIDPTDGPRRPAGGVGVRGGAASAARSHRVVGGQLERARTGAGPGGEQLAGGSAGVAVGLGVAAARTRLGRVRHEWRPLVSGPVRGRPSRWLCRMTTAAAWSITGRCRRAEMPPARR